MYSLTPSAPTASRSCWIDPAGLYFQVDHSSHLNFADAICAERRIPRPSDNWTVGTLESAGWLHISNGEIYSDRRQPTPAQADTLFAWAMVLRDGGFAGHATKALAYVERTVVRF